MRVSTGMLQETALNELQTVWSRLQKLQSNMATGRRIHRPSDDVIGSSHVMRASGNIRMAEQYKRNLAESRQFAMATESALVRLVDLADTIQMIAVQVADESYGPDSRGGLATELDGLLEEALGLANTSNAGMQLFGGFETREESYTADTDGEGNLVAVRRQGQGLDGELKRSVGENVLLTINLTGTDLFGEEQEFFKNLIALRDIARAGDCQAARDLVGTLLEDQDRINLAQAVTGGLLSRMDGMEEWLDHQILELEATRSEFEDLDMARASLDYQKEQAILQAALSATVQIMDLSLVQFMVR
ncbi:MAG: hypothetical protein KAY24_01495 [Candidatus Eisenbacteria sp.]|nr:hypothetical protein [Candidatus Eisenbacteria bacterium]